MKRTSEIISLLLTTSIVLLIGCSNETDIHNEQAASNLQPEIDELKERVAQLESRLSDLETAVPVPDANASVAVVVPPSMTIWTAAAKGNRKEIELHIVAGTDLNNLGQAPLHHAAANNHTYIIKLLLANGADANVLDERGHGTRLGKILEPHRSLRPSPQTRRQDG